MYHIMMTNQSGDVSYFDYDRHSGHEERDTFGFGKSFGSYEEALEVLNKVFVHQGDKRTPNYLIHNVTGVCKNRTSGSVEARIVKLVPEPVNNEEARKFVEAAYRSDADMLHIYVDKFENGEQLGEREFSIVLEAVRNKKVILGNVAKDRMMRIILGDERLN